MLSSKKPVSLQRNNLEFKEFCKSWSIPKWAYLAILFRTNSSVQSLPARPWWYLRCHCGEFPLCRVLKGSRKNGRSLFKLLNIQVGKIFDPSIKIGACLKCHRFKVRWRCTYRFRLHTHAQAKKTRVQRCSESWMRRWASETALLRLRRERGWIRRNSFSLYHLLFLISHPELTANITYA